MGTKVQSKGYSTGHCSIWNLNESASTGIWPSYQEDKALKNVQHYVSFLPRQVMMDGYLGHEKENVRQMILEHESTFRHQLQELHRLYGRQRELMYEFKRRELKNGQLKAEMPDSSTLTSEVSSKDSHPTWKVSHTPFLHPLLGQSSKSPTSSLPSFRKGKSMPGPLPSRDPEASEKHGVPNNNSTLLQRGTVDLEVPDDVCMNDGGENLHENICGLPRSVSGPPSSILEILHGKDGGSSFGSILNYLNGDALRSNSCLNRSELADLNEPVPVEESSDPAFAANPGVLICALSSPCSKASQAKPSKTDEFSTSDQGLSKSKVKRKLFGVDIFEVSDEPLVTDSSMVSYIHKLDSKSLLLQDKINGSISNAKGEVAHRNGISLSSQLNAKQLQGSSTIGCNLTNDMTTKDVLPKPSGQKALLEYPEGLDCFRWKSAEVLKTDTKSSCLLQDDVVPEHNILCDPQSELRNAKASLLHHMETEDCGEQIRANKNSYHLNLDSLQNSCQQFFQKARTTLLPSQNLNCIKETTSPHFIQDTEHESAAVDEFSTTKTIFGFPIANKLSDSKQSSFGGIISKVKHFHADGDNPGNVLVEKVVSSDRPEAKDQVLEESLNNSLSGLRHHFDLNLSSNEEEIPSAASLPSTIVKLATTEIGLETPVVLESQGDIHRNAAKVTNLSQAGLVGHHEELLKVAAEALVAISLSGAQHILSSTTPEPQEAAPSDCLKWFAEVVSSYKCDDQSNGGLDLDGAFSEELIPDGMDYFEFMTLKLKDTKEENYYYRPLVVTNENDEEIKVVTLSRRPRRGQARRGRQRKDFQRDVLPGLISLSKHDVTEDFQTFEELFRSSGSTWQSSFARKNAAKSCRGRRRSKAMAPSLETDVTVPPPEQQTVCREVQLEEKTLTGWGKRTRRLPRQRYINGNPALPLKC